MNFDAPQIIKDLSELDYNFTDDDDSFDFYGYGKFLDAKETAHLAHCWTGDQNYHGEEFRIFGSGYDGSDYAFWIVNQELSILEQPVVFLDSEGQVYTISTNYSDFLWYMFGNENNISKSLQDYLLKNITTPKRTKDEILDEANEKYAFYNYLWSKVIYKDED